MSVSNNKLFVGFGTEWFNEFHNLKHNPSEYIITTMKRIIKSYSMYQNTLWCSPTTINILSAEIVCDCKNNSPRHRYEFKINKLHEMCHRDVIAEIIDRLNRYEIDKIDLTSSTGLELFCKKRFLSGKHPDSIFFIAGEVVANRFRIIDHLIDGSSCSVFVVKDITDVHNRDLVMKVSHAKEDDISSLIRECEKIEKLQNVKRHNKSYATDNDIVFPEFIAKFELPSWSWTSDIKHVAVVIERYGRDLYDCMTGDKHMIFTLRHIQKIVRQLTKTIKIVHELKMIHKDIKCENVLLRNRDTDDVILIDYGLSLDFQNDTDRFYALRGTLAYLTPEELIGIGYNRSVDVFNIAINAIELYNCRFLSNGDVTNMLAMYRRGYRDLPDTYNPQFINENQFAEIKRIERLKPRFQREFIDNYLVNGVDDGDFIDFIKRCTVLDIDSRLTPDEMLNHPFLTKNIAS